MSFVGTTGSQEADNYVREQYLKGVGVIQIAHDLFIKNLTPRILHSGVISNVAKSLGCTPRRKRIAETTTFVEKRTYRPRAEKVLNEITELMTSNLNSELKQKVLAEMVKNFNN
jgi:hypothetical protein